MKPQSKIDHESIQRLDVSTDRLFINAVHQELRLARAGQRRGRVGALFAGAAGLGKTAEEQQRLLQPDEPVAGARARRVSARLHFCPAPRRRVECPEIAADKGVSAAGGGRPGDGKVGGKRT